MDYEQFRHWTLTSVEDIGRKFTRPDDEWSAVLLFQSPRGGGIALIDPRFFRSGASKDELVAVLSRLLLQNQAMAYALVLEVWASYPGRTPTPRVRGVSRGTLLPEDDPQRQELLWVTVTDDLHEEIWLAAIRRSTDRPPRLGRWEKIDLKDPREGVFSGRFIEPLRAVLQEARARNN